MPIPSLPLRHVAALVAALASFASFAEDPPKKADPTKSAAPVMSRAELRSCLDEEATLKARRAKLDEASRDFDAARVAIEKEHATMNASQSSVDTKDEKAVAAFNQRAQDLNKRSQDHNLQAQTLNATSADLQAAAQRFSVRCADRHFLPSDREAILKERNAASTPKP